MTILEAVALKTSYGRVPALFGVDFQIAENDFVGILGHNGMGKTTLLKTLMGFLPATAGDIRLAGTSIARLPPERRARSGLGYVPQGRQIFSALSVLENLKMGCLLARTPERDTIAEILTIFPRLKRLLDRPGGALSGGEQQLLALARCLCGNPRIMLLDEPTEGIQPSIIEEMIDTLRALAVQRGMTVLLVEQNLKFISALSQRILILQKGRILRELPREALSRPEMLEEFVGAAL